ncbi:hypothetical protein AB0B28_16275 [Glycomyces sp. NPDC046736]|uniref:hypothetical protein n=1 Tax=Glycomyces sp. NPDC046736 TaxID=3155615 RepID=UPI0033E1DE39
MVKLPHEALHQIFRESPNLFADTVQRVCDVDFPDIVEYEVVDTDLTEIRPLVRRPDTVIRAETPSGPHLLVVEAQNREEPAKIRSWAYYLSYLESRYDLPATLLVTTPSAATARWARGPFRLGLAAFPSVTVSPLVAGPDNVPFVTEVEDAVEDVAFAVFSALTHRLNPDIEKALGPLAQALDTVQPEQGAVWADLIEVGLAGCAQDFWRKIMQTMQYEFGSQLAQQSAAKAEARIILKFLDMRGVFVSDEDRRRIESCTDLEMLEAWVMRAPSVESVDELF